MDQCPKCSSSVESGSPVCPACGSLLGGTKSPTRALEGIDASTGAPNQPPASSPTQTAAGRFATGAMIDNRYRVIEMLGRGGMGEVYRAEDQRLGVSVALKFLPPDLAADPIALARLRDEVKLARRVSHPNVCRVHDMGMEAGQPFITMEYVDGEDLATLLRRIGRVAGERAIEIAREITSGLAASHAAGILHRDLKPANVMLDRNGQTRVTDFGLAITGEEARRTNEIAGTPAYMSPEQLNGEGPSVRSDLYALGLLLYELLTGKRAFQASTLKELGQQQRDMTASFPATLSQELGPGAEKTILQCLAWDPQRRPESAMAVLTALCGGDPMGAALAAGQTPSPAAVAAAPVQGALRPVTAWLCFAGIVISLIMYLTLGGRISFIERARLPLPPAALAEKAREAFRDLGYGGANTHEAYGFAYGNTGGVETAESEQHLIVFWYRSSPFPMLPEILYDSKVTFDAPPLGEDDVAAWFASDGRLLSLTAMPSNQSTTSRAVREPDTTTLFRLAGLDLSTLSPTTPSRKPPVYADRRLAWTRRAPDGFTSTVEASFNDGRVVDFSMNPNYAPRTRLARTNAVLIPSDLWNLIKFAILLASIPLARRNLRRGSGDRQGARKLAAFVFTTNLVWALLSASHVAQFQAEDSNLIAWISMSLYYGGTAWMLYIALEPLVRRVWPEKLVSWTRLLVGHFGDPMVARDVLVATTFYFAYKALEVGFMALQSHAPLFVGGPLDPLVGLNHSFALTLWFATNAVRVGLMALLLLFLLRRLGGKGWIATAGLLVVVTLLVGVDFGTKHVSYLAFAMVTSIFFVILLTRFGLLAAVAYLFIAYSLWGTTSLTSWYSGCTWWNIGVVMACALSGLYYSTARRPFGDRELIDA